MATSDENLPKFASIDEELEWYKSRLAESQLELEEFQLSSKDLESELETQLTQSEKENRDLKAAKQKIEAERDLYADKFVLVTTELKGQLEQLEDDLHKEKECNERLSRLIRGLEQNNDDLERAKRALAASLEEFESRLNNAIERNAFLESELDEKEQLSVMVQRLKEETRDLKQELYVQKRHVPVATSRVTNSGEEFQPPGSAVSASMMHEKKKSINSSGGRPNALDIVNDLLRKVGTLMNVALTPPPSRRRSRSSSKRVVLEANNNGSSERTVIRDKETVSLGSAGSDDFGNSGVLPRSHHSRRRD
ncbi:nuclear distribution protein nudE-like 1-B [Varroa jacobsoni]|uniref:NUDE domain-containing protein n=1 Tax=Varroa destructor TaxID=109461 RepID=A0A7M7JSP0_VARDE|nr:nuclear distribution protein nudE-like 1-B [Varroa destructor]XP_022690417.1 nuclear distribution protein nudE-like 1-B [Varroa jacobsoni]